MNPRPSLHPVDDVPEHFPGVPAVRVDDFCATCAFASVCALAGYGRPELSELHYLVEHIGPFEPGQYLFRNGDPFVALYTVRSGMLKTTTVDIEGRGQIPGFILPGEVLGFDAIYPRHYPYDAIALETTQVCRFSFRTLSTLAAFQPQIQQHLFQTFSKELNASNLVIAGHGSSERLAAFLIDLGHRYQLRGLSGTRFRLSMTHADIANHLHIAAETVSRVLGQFREQGLIALENRAIDLLDRPRLQQLANRLLAGKTTPSLPSEQDKP